MRRTFLIGVALLWPAIAFAQPAPTVTSTLRTTSTASTSVRVGCTQSGTCTGGIVAGPIDVSAITSAGPIGIASSVPGDTSLKLYNDAGTLKWNGVALDTGGSSVSGTNGYIAMFTGAASVGNSVMVQTAGNTITVGNTLNATTLGGTLSTATQNSVTTMTGLVTVGTIGTGIWQGTKVDLAYGGTNADLSATGGTSQFLRQNTVGAAVSVVRPAVSDLSDAANVALLAAANTFTLGQTINPAAAGNAFLSFTVGGVSNTVGMSGAIKGSAATDLGFAADTGKGMDFMVNGSTTNSMTLSSAGILTLSGFGLHTISAGGAGPNGLDIRNTTSGTGNYAVVQSVAGTSVSTLNTYSQGFTTSGSAIASGVKLEAEGAGGLALSAVNGAGKIGFYTAGASNLRWGINAAGDWTFGASSHIADSVGTPSISSGFGSSPTIAGTDYAFKVVVGSVASTTTSTVNFGHTWSTIPVCTANVSGLGATLALAPSTTQFVIAPSADWSGFTLYVLCRSY